MLYDALVDPATLELAPVAQRVFVGKRAGRPQVRQEFIHWLMVRAARAGKKVVRLKGGDPFVFGRGGEEGLALAAAGHRVRGRSWCELGDRGRRARGHPGDPSWHRGGVRRRLGSRRGRVSTDSREPGAAERDGRRDDGPRPGSSRLPKSARRRGWNAIDARGGHIWSVDGDVESCGRSTLRDLQQRLRASIERATPGDGRHRRRRAAGRALERAGGRRGCRGGPQTADGESAVGGQ